MANRRTILATLVILAIASVSEGQRAQARLAPKIVRLVIDYGDGVQKHFTQLDWKEGMTVLDAMRAAREHPRGIAFDSRGKRATLFIFKIDGLENETQGKGWLYKVNDKLADRSCGIYELEAGDAVLWTFEEYR
jgi:hypothetical protein